MEDRGIEHVYYFQVDNPLVPVPDPVFIGHHAKTDAEMSSKVLRKRSPDEPIGTVVMREGRVEVVEYSDISPELRDAAGADGAPLFPWGSIAIHGLSVRFVRRFTDEGIELPYHVARKKIAHVDDEGRTVAPEERNGIKFEMFIFDALRHAERSVTMEVRREDEFAPVKNAEGADSVATARRSLSGLYARWLEGAGVRVEREPDGAVAGHVEISPLTADSAEALKEALPEGTEFRDGLAL
jgi:UDP-N-acetylglucosamine/UDP-N-acetylgalactosamine diphosphorylase